MKIICFTILKCIHGVINKNITRKWLKENNLLQKIDSPCWFLYENHERLLRKVNICNKYHCAKSVQIWSFFWSLFSRIRTGKQKKLREITNKKSLGTLCEGIVSKNSSSNTRKYNGFLQCFFYVLRFESCINGSPKEYSLLENIFKWKVVIYKKQSFDLHCKLVD